MRILIVSKLDARRPYGGSNRAFHLGRHLAAKASVCHVGPDCSGVDYGPTFSTGSLALPAFLQAISRARRTFQPDVVFSIEGRANLACRLLGMAARCPGWVIGFDSSPAFEWHSYRRSGDFPRARCLARYAASRMLEASVLRSGAPVVVVSSFLRELVTSWYHVDPARVHIVPNGAPPELLIRPPSPPPSPYRSLGPTVAAVVAPRNFHSNVLAVRFVHQVAEQLLALDTAAQIAVIGGGPVLETTSNVHYLGHVDDVVPYIDFADVCLLPYPSTAVCGGTRLKAMEYFARSKPVLTTPEGLRGIEGVHHGVEAVVAPPEPRAFARALLDMLRAPAEHRQLGAAARRLVAERYDWALLAGRLLSVFDSTLEANGVMEGIRGGESASN